MHRLWLESNCPRIAGYEAQGNYTVAGNNITCSVRKDAASSRCDADEACKAFVYDFSSDLSCLKYSTFPTETKKSVCLFVKTDRICPAVSGYSVVENVDVSVLEKTSITCNTTADSAALLCGNDNICQSFVTLESGSSVCLKTSFLPPSNSSQASKTCMYVKGEA
jgi:hypothetical protein